MHGLCLGECCKYKKAQGKRDKCQHRDHNHVNPVIMDMIKPIFRDLSDPELLRKCLHRTIQNVNESLSNIIWEKIPKNIFVKLPILKLGTYVGTFNEGNIVKCKVLNELDIMLSFEHIRQNEDHRRSSFIYNNGRKKQ